MLKIKEFTTFYRCLKTFMEWAKTTDLTDLNFMVPADDQAVQEILQNYMEKGQIDLAFQP